MLSIHVPTLFHKQIITGVTRRICKDSYLTLAFMYSLKNNVKGSNPFEVSGQQLLEITMMQ